MFTYVLYSLQRMPYVDNGYFHVTAWTNASWSCNVTRCLLIRSLCISFLPTCRHRSANPNSTANNTANTSTTTTSSSSGSGSGVPQRPLVLALGDCVPVRPWSDSPITCLAELRMVWRDKVEQCLLTGLRLYFLPENTPNGRRSHGEVSTTS